MQGENIIKANSVAMVLIFTSNVEQNYAQLHLEAMVVD